YGDRALRMRQEVVELQHVPDLDAGAFRDDFRLARRDDEWYRRVESFCEKENLLYLKQRLRKTAREPEDFQAPIADFATGSLIQPSFSRWVKKANKSAVEPVVKSFPPAPPFTSSRPGDVPPCSKDTGPVFVVTNAAEAEKVMKVLRKHRDTTVFAVTTEAEDDADALIPPRPVCLSIYGGQGVTFGNGCRRVWADLLSSAGDWAQL
ncbi:unnamed protein product, partial [Polarella glacialis]